jgi:hypothetical protein
MALVFNAIEGTFDFVGIRGPNGATDKGIARYNGTSGQVIQDSKAVVQDGGAVVAQGFVANKLITDTITIGANQVYVTSGFSIELTGELVIDADGELVLV